jgi:hypothetical protein
MEVVGTFIGQVDAQVEPQLVQDLQGQPEADPRLAVFQLGRELLAHPGRGGKIVQPYAGMLAGGTDGQAKRIGRVDTDLHDLFLLLQEF